MRPRCSRLVVALALLGTVSAGTAPASRAAAPFPASADSRLGAVQPVLDARVAALAAGNRSAWLATVDPSAPPTFRDGQGILFDNLRSLPLSRFLLTARTADSGDLSAGLSATYGGVPVFLPETRQVMRFAGYDDRDAVDSLWLTFVQRAGTWYVGGDNDLAPLGLDTARGLWDFGPVRVHPTAHFLVLSHPAQASRADALAAIAEEAIGLLNQRWNRPWLDRIPLILPGSEPELEQMLQSTVDLNKFVAFTVYGAVRDTGWEATAPRIYIQDLNLSRYSHGFQVQTLVHELTHAAASGLAGPEIPSWVHEGVADWVAKGRSTAERRPAGAEAHLPRDYQFTTGTGASILLSYDESRSAISVLARDRGIDAPAAFFTALGALRVTPGSSDYQTDAALRAATGWGVADLERTWSTG
jgi:hypothetical protein